MELINSFKKIIPRIELRSDIEYFWVLSLKKDSKFIHKMIPESAFEIIFQSNQGTIQKFNNSTHWEMRPQHFIGGLFTQPYQVKCIHDTVFIGVRFYPGKAHSFINENLYLFKNKLENISDVFGARFTKHIDNLDTFESKIDFLQSYLVNKKKNLIHAKVNSVLEKIYTSNQSLKSICKNLSISQSYLRKKFSETVGISPKDFKKIQRINNVLTLSKKITLSQSIYSQEYFDYSHFTKDFQSIVGESPRSYYKNNYSLIKCFQDQKSVFYNC